MAPKGHPIPTAQQALKTVGHLQDGRFGPRIVQDEPPALPELPTACGLSNLPEYLLGTPPTTCFMFARRDMIDRAHWVHGIDI